MNTKHNTYLCLHKYAYKINMKPLKYDFKKIHNNINHNNNHNNNNYWNKIDNNKTNEWINKVIMIQIHKINNEIYKQQIK